MSLTSLTISPEDVGTSRTGTRPAWLDQVAAFVQKAAADGETVTVTAELQMMTPEEVAAAMGVSRSTISRRIKAGELHAVKVGNRNRIPYLEFKRFWRATMADIVDLTSDDIEADLFDDE